MVVTRGGAFWHYNEIASAAKQGRFLLSGKSSSQLALGLHARSLFQRLLGFLNPRYPRFPSL
jgi:hypothetical protein